MKKLIIPVAAVAMIAAFGFSSCSKKAEKADSSAELTADKSAVETENAENSSETSSSSKTSHRAEIDAFLKSYEEMAQTAERLAASNKVMDLLDLAGKIDALDAKSSKIEDYDDFTADDTAKLTAYTLRITKAMEKTANSTDSLDFGLGGLGF